MEALKREEEMEKMKYSLEMYKLKHEANTTTIKKLKANVAELQDQIKEEIKEKEFFIKTSNTRQLKEDLKEERIQRLQDLEMAQVKEREIKALSRETAVATKGALAAQQEAANNRAEIIALRKTLECSSKLLRASEKDYIVVHKELEDTQLKLLSTRRSLASKTEEVNTWVSRYEQAMIDLHVSQMKLANSATGKTSKSSAFIRGYGVVLAESGGEPVLLKPIKKKSAASDDDMALRRFQHDLKSSQDRSRYLPTAASSSKNQHHRNAISMLPTTSNNQKKKPSRTKFGQNDSMRSKFIGRGLGVIKSDPIISKTK